MPLTDDQLECARNARSHGMSLRDICEGMRTFGISISKSHLHRLLKIPYRRPENSEIVFPPGGQLTPRSPATAILDGDPAYCVVSDLTGIEDHPRLRKPTPRTKPESKHKFRPKGKPSA